MRTPVRALASGVAAAAAAAALVAGAAAAAPLPGSGSPATVPPVQARANGFFGIVPASTNGSRPTASAPAGTSAAAAGNLTYHGGPVMHSNRTYAIYWAPSGYALSSSYRTLIDRFFNDVAAASSSTTNVYSSDTQYYDSSGSILYSSSYGGSIVDTNPLPSSGCVDRYTTVCLTDAQVRTEIQRIVTQQRWGAGPSSLFFIFTAKGIGSCFDGSGSSCAFSNYCAYHSNIGTGASEILYANMPYADSVPNLCDTGQHPNGDDADATLNVASHEHNEAITDPLGTAWYDSVGDENGDKCAWTFGATLGTTGSGAFNQVINGHDYYLQQEWSNATSGCVLTFGNVAAPVNTGLPVVSGSAQAGQTLSASTGSWSGTAPLAYAYQWQRCSPGCVAVGANANTYALTSADVGSTIQVAVTASNSAGSSVATSAGTAVVTGASSSGTVTVPLASAADNGEVDVSGPQAAGYPPTAAPIVYTGATLTAGRRLAYGSYGIYEPLLRFNTAGLLPQGATITSATLKLYLNRWTSADKRNLVAEWLPTATWPLAAADWALTSSANALAPVPLSSLTGNAVNSFTLTGLENITTGGYTTIRLEVDGGQPAGDNYAQFASYQAATSKPQLILDYTTP